MRISILTIGDELLDGRQANGNALELSEKLTEIGWEVVRILTVSDELEEIVEAMKIVSSGCNAVVVSGGLGPTSDDRTRFAAARYFDEPLTLDANEVARIHKVLEDRQRTWTESNAVQALKPRNCYWLKSSLGTASGFTTTHQEVLWFFLPGVPFEMRHLFESEIKYLLPQADSIWLKRRLRFWNYSESQLSQSLSGWEWGEDWRFGSLPSEEGLLLKVDHKLYLPATAESRAEAEKRLDERVAEMRRVLNADRYLYSATGRSIEEELVERLIAEKRKLAVAESCTGGGIGERVTRVAGSSACFAGGVIAYSNSAKSDLLGVEPELIKKEGAVSQQVVEAMARGVAERLNAECAVAVSGIAGPGGGTAEKPVGTLWAAAYCDGEVVSEESRFFATGGRSAIRRRSEVAALDLLRRLLDKK